MILFAQFQWYDCTYIYIYRCILLRELSNVLRKKQNYGLVLKGDRIVIPPTLRPEVLNIIHQGHLGQEKCLLRARSSVFWPGITKKVINQVNQCDPCQKYQRKAAKEPILQPEPPLETDQPIRMYAHHSQTWEPSVVIKPTKQPRSYDIRSSTTSATYRRTWSQLKPDTTAVSDSQREQMETPVYQGQQQLALPLLASCRHRWKTVWQTIQRHQPTFPEGPQARLVDMWPDLGELWHPHKG